MRSFRARRRHAAIYVCCAALALLALVLAGCGSTAAPNPGPYGGTANHLHDMLALQGVPDTILLASHLGIYRSADAGKTWTQVSGATGQQMAELMPYKLVQSPTDPKRIYVPAIPRILGGSATIGTPGIYMSTDAGATWKLITPMTTFPGGTVYSLGSGENDGQLYALVPVYTGFQPYALYVTTDNGAHWKKLADLPTNTPTGIATDTHHAGRLVLWSASNGIFLSDDGGQTWRPAANAQKGVNTASVVVGSIYAAGDSGIYVSHDDGDSFTLVPVQGSFITVETSAANTQDAYAMVSNGVYATTDGGKTWHVTAALARDPASLSADPANGSIVYIGHSLPIGVEVSANVGTSWRTLMP